MKKSVVLYDAECPLCIRTKKWVNLFDLKNRLLWLSLQDMETYADLPSYKKEDIRDRLHLYDPDRKEHSGYDAVTYLFRESPVLHVAGRLMSLPPVRRLGIPVYLFVARNRYRIGIHDCKNGSCSI